MTNVAADWIEYQQRLRASLTLATTLASAARLGIGLHRRCACSSTLPPHSHYSTIGMK